MRRSLLTIIIFFTFFGFVVNAEAQSRHGLFTEALKRSVTNGLVNYSNLCKDSSFPKYIEQIMRMNPDTLPTAEAKLAFWINAYNAYTLDTICDHYPIKSINNLNIGGLAFSTLVHKTVWDRKNVMINNEFITLNTIEHEIVPSISKDPRIHFALVNATKGSPPLRSEAYEGHSLDAQLDDQGRKFLSESAKNWFDRRQNIANLSPIFDWFKNDFGANQEERLRYLCRFLSPDAAEAIKKWPSAWKIRFIKFDWDLNER